MSGWSRSGQDISLKESVADMPAENRTALMNTNDSTSPRESMAFLPRLPRSVAPPGAEEQLQLIRDPETGSPATHDPDTRDPVADDPMTREPVTSDRTNCDQVLRDLTFRRRADAVFGFSNGAEYPGPSEWDRLQGPPAPGPRSALRHRVRRLVSQVSRAVTWLPRMMSRRMHSLGRWMSPRAPRWSGPSRGAPAAQLWQEGQHDYQQNQHGYQDVQNGYQGDQHGYHEDKHGYQDDQHGYHDDKHGYQDAQQGYWEEQHGQQRRQTGQQDYHRQPAAPEHAPAVLDRRLACACDDPSERNYRSVHYNNGMGHFLSTSFWIPALGLFYLLGFAR